MLAGALFAGSAAPVAAIQVVGDAACGYYDVDIAAFATCVDGRVVKPDAPPVTGPAQADGTGTRPAPSTGVTEPTSAERARPRALRTATRPADQPR
jgi:hypothetical protein